MKITKKQLRQVIREAARLQESTNGDWLLKDIMQDLEERLSFHEEGGASETLARLWSSDKKMPEGTDPGKWDRALDEAQRSVANYIELSLKVYAKEIRRHMDLVEEALMQGDWPFDNLYRDRPVSERALRESLWIDPDQAAVEFAERLLGGAPQDQALDAVISGHHDVVDDPADLSAEEREAALQDLLARSETLDTMYLLPW